MTARSRQALGSLALAVGVLCVTFATPAAQTPPGTGKPWTVPRTPDGKPDLQGNWSNETQTPLERMGKDSALTPEQAAALEERARVVDEFRDKPSDPNRPPPVKGGDPKSLTPPGQPSFIELIAQAAGGAVGGDDAQPLWLDQADRLEHRLDQRRPGAARRLGDAERVDGQGIVHSSSIATAGSKK